MSHKPDEQQIAQMLSDLPPEPSADFHKRMKNAPWNQPKGTNRPSIHYRFPRQLLTIAAALLLISIFILVTPLRSLAQEVWQEFFSRQSDDIWTAEYRPSGLPTPTLSPEVIQATLQASPPEIADIEAQVGFDVLEPAYLPPGYILRDVYASDGRYTSEGTPSVMLSYGLADDDDPLFRNLVIMQTVSHAGSPIPVGASADVQEVPIGTVTGQYVQGGWQTVGVIEDDQTGQKYIDSEWNNDIEMHRLIWQMNGFTYEVLFQAAYMPHPAYYDSGASDQPGYLTLDDLVTIAESLE